MLLQVLRRLESSGDDATGTPEWSGHVWQGHERIMADSRHRLQDLRIAKDTNPSAGVLR